MDHLVLVVHPDHQELVDLVVHLVKLVLQEQVDRQELVDRVVHQELQLLYLVQVMYLLNLQEQLQLVILITMYMKIHQMVLYHLVQQQTQQLLHMVR